MFNFDKSGSAILSVIGALVLTVTFVGAAVGPARAIETTPVAMLSAPANA